MDQNCDGSDINIVFNGRDKWSFETPDIIASENHYVLFRLPLVDDLKPHGAPDKWDSNHVRMPCSPNSEYVEQDEESGMKTYKSRWSLIETCLLRADFDSSHELEEAIKKYNNRYSSIWDFSSFHHFVNNELSQSYRTHFLKFILPRIIGLALRLPLIIQCPIPLLKRGSFKSISMTQEQAACIIANCFLCTWPRRNTTKRDSEFGSYPDINFSNLYRSDVEKATQKLYCIIKYFESIFSEAPKGVLTFTRKSLKADQFPNWSHNTKTFSNMKYYISSREAIEDADGMLQVDFANRFVGGGVLSNGLIQEEIRFLINTELIVARLFTECLDNEEALVVIGAEQFNKYKGYASTFKFAGQHRDLTPTDRFRRRKCQIVAIDALQLNNNFDQFRESNIIRELNKAYAGFYNPYNDGQPVSTGSWGSGAFMGNSLRSALIQLIVCRQSQRNMAFFTFKDQLLQLQISEIFKCLVEESVTVEKLIQILKKFRFSGNTVDNESLFKFVKNEIQTVAVPKKIQNSLNSYYPSLIRKLPVKHSNLKPIEMHQAVKLPSPPPIERRPFSFKLPQYSGEAATTSSSKIEFINEKVVESKTDVPKPMTVQDGHTKPKRSLLELLNEDFN